MRRDLEVKKSSKILSPKKQLKLILKSIDTSKTKKKLAQNYIKGRGLKQLAKRVHFISHLHIDPIKGDISSSVILPITNIKGEIVGVEVRALSPMNKNRYSKILKDEVQIYNLDKHYKERAITLTEGIIDSETLEENGISSVSGLRASVQKSTLHTLALHFNKIVVVFDNDESGVKGAKEIKKFFNSYYKEIEVEVVKISKYSKKIKDINDLHLEDSKAFKKLVKDLKSLLV